MVEYSLNWRLPSSSADSAEKGSLHWPTVIESPLPMSFATYASARTAERRIPSFA
jgi:hypothetical protein